MTGSKRYLCPLTGCNWHHDEPDPLLDYTTPLEAQEHRRAARIERTLSDHHTTHEVTEYLREIQQLRAGCHKAAIGADSIVEFYLDPGRIPLARKLLEGLRTDLEALSQPEVDIITDI